jgi:hypothetical protein
MTPSYVVAPVFTFLGVILAVVIGPRALWNLEKNANYGSHRRHLIKHWRKMVSDIMVELDGLDQAKEQWHTGDVRRLLERH